MTELRAGVPAAAHVYSDGRWVDLPAIREAFLAAGFVERTQRGPQSRACVMVHPDGYEALVPLVGASDSLLRVATALQVLATVDPSSRERIDLAVLTPRELVLWRALVAAQGQQGQP